MSSFGKLPSLVEQGIRLGPAHNPTIVIISQVHALVDDVGSLLRPRQVTNAYHPDATWSELLVNASYEPTEALSGKFGLFSPERREQAPRIVLSHHNVPRVRVGRMRIDTYCKFHYSTFVHSCLMKVEISSPGTSRHIAHGGSV